MALELVTVDQLTKLEDGEDAEFFLTAAEQAVRDYCGWHIAGSKTVEDKRFRVGERGLLIIPTMHLTDVAEITVGGRQLDADEYDWEPSGVITRRCPSWPTVNPWVTVTFTHGYEECPASVAMVVLELASLARQMPASPAKDIYAGPFRMSLSGKLGASMSKDQQDRLANYRLVEFGFGIC